MRCKSVLVVEDEPEIRYAIQLALESEGFPVVTATNGRDAIEKLDVIEKPCVILLDVMMPVMDGWQFLQAIRKNNCENTVATIPVVIVSASMDAGRLAAEKGATAFVKKPIDLDILYDAVRKYCH